ncbi:MAG: cell division protein FtsK [Rhodobacteraceae bacterium]|nr:cell division protein FtsK [Paracoccaceae bacterium]
MAYHTRSRDPLLDSTMQAAVERRGKELIGILLLALGTAAMAMILSYTPDDPNWMVSTDAPVQNWLGRPGASIAAPLFMVVGWGAIGFAGIFLAWGLRFMLHRGEDRAINRLIIAPIAVGILSIYAATLVPGAEWRATHSFGLGGLFGDTAMGALLTLLPIGSHLAVKLTSLLMAVAAVSIGLFVTGFTRAELGRFIRFLLLGIVMGYSAILSVVGRGARGASDAARMRAELRAQRKAEAAFAAEEAARQAAPPPVAAPKAPARQAAPLVAPPRVNRASSVPAAPRVTAASRVPEPEPDYDDYGYDPDYEPDYGYDAPPEPVHAPVPVPQPRPQPERGGLLSRMPSLIRRPDPEPEPMPEAELVEVEPHEFDGEGYSDDRIRAKIADAVRSRRGMPEPVPAPVDDPTKPLTRGRGHGPKPLIANLTPRQRQAAAEQEAARQDEVALPPEPPLSRHAPHAALPPEPPLTSTQTRMAPPPVSAPPRAVAPQPVNAPALQPVVARAAAPRPADRPALELVPEPDYEDEAQVFDDDYDDEDYGDEDYGMDHMPEPIPVVRGAAHAIPVPEPKKVVQNPARKAPQPSKRARAEAQPSLSFEDKEQGYELPPLSLLTNPAEIERHHLSDEALEENARMLENVLDDYGVKGEIVSVRPGPVVTMYELEPAPGLKASRVIGLADDIARSMSALSARVSTVPGRSVIGIELPNDKREMVVLREILSSRDFDDSNMRLPLALGKDIGGEAMVANLAKMPHLLIAGTTGSGKSVAINTMILSLLYKLTPDECRLIMIDPKMLELSVYDGIPHLLSPVVTDPKKAVVALKWTVGEMEERYRKMSKTGVRNIDGYNARVQDALSKGETFSRTVQTGFDDETGDPVFETEEIIPEKMPYIVVIVDEMADLMMVAGKEIEACIQRLAQMARASGIHLIMATQRPSVDVITGTIKANFPTRISFQVTSKVDSRTILGEMGAEQLLGMGDMLYMAGGAKITRCHGPFVSDEEVEDLVNHLKAYGPPEYVGTVLDGPDEERESDIDAVLGLGGNTTGEDALYDQAVQIVIKDRKCSTSYIQRKLGIGYNKAARLVEQMEDESLVSPANHVGKREILVPEQQ